MSTVNITVSKAPPGTRHNYGYGKKPHFGTQQRQPISEITIANIDATLNALDIPRWFPDYDHELFYLAFLPRGSGYNNSDIIARIHERFPYTKDQNYELLEFYGDTVLYLLFIDIFAEFNGTRNTLKYLHEIKNYIASNNFLRELSHMAGICDTVYNMHRNLILPKHNVCSDSFEALFGALYIQYGMQGLPWVKAWFIQTFPYVLNYIRRTLYPYIFIPVTFSSDPTDLIARFEEINPRCKVMQVGSAAAPMYDLYIDGLYYDSNPILDQLFPTLIGGQINTTWQYMGYTGYIRNEEDYICDKKPQQYVCDAKLNRVSRYNPRVKTCHKKSASGPCNILVDDLPLKELALKTAPEKEHKLARETAPVNELAREIEQKKDTSLAAMGKILKEWRKKKQWPDFSWTAVDNKTPGAKSVILQESLGKETTLADFLQQLDTDQIWTKWVAQVRSHMSDEDRARFIDEFKVQ